MLLFVLVSSVCCSDAWGALPYTKGDSVGGSDRKGLTIGKFVLRDERQEECLFLDAVLLRGITKEGDAKHAGVETRSAPVTDLATYGAFGISGYVYDAVWDGTQNPDFMYEVERRCVGSGSELFSAQYGPERAVLCLGSLSGCSAFDL